MKLKPAAVKGSKIYKQKNMTCQKPCFFPLYWDYHEILGAWIITEAL